VPAPSRRTVLRSVAAGAVIGSAGCLRDDVNTGNGGDTDATDAENDGNRSTDNSIDDETEERMEPSIQSRDINTIETSCGTQDSDSSRSTIDDDELLVSGTITAPNPCHDATLEETVIEDSELVVTIGIESTAEVCQDCIGAIEYIARFDVEGLDQIEDVMVEHVS